MWVWVCGFLKVTKSLVEVRRYMRIFIKYALSDWDYLPLMACGKRTYQVIIRNMYSFNKQCMVVQTITKYLQERII